MEYNLTWNKGIFESNYQILEGGKTKSTMLFDTWRSNANVVGQQMTYRFADNGLYASITQIFDGSNNLLGSITYNDLQSKATITLNSGEQFGFQFTNTWFSKWTITNFSDKQINYDSSSAIGLVSANNDDELMLLMGFYVREHFTKMFMLLLFVAVCIPIILHGAY